MQREVIERILKRVRHDGGCWIVSGWSDGKGYRNVSIDGKTVKVHRAVFEWFWRRKLRKDVQVDHKCCNRSCCNPLHLQTVKNKKNSILRNKRKGKHGRDETLDRRSAESCTITRVQTIEQSGEVQASKIQDGTIRDQQQLCDQSQYCTTNYYP